MSGEVAGEMVIEVFDPNAAFEQRDQCRAIGIDRDVERGHGIAGRGVNAAQQRDIALDAGNQNGVAALAADFHVRVAAERPGGLLPILLRVGAEQVEALARRRRRFGEHGQAGRIGAALAHADQHRREPLAQLGGRAIVLHHQADDAAHEIRSTPGIAALPSPTRAAGTPPTPSA